MENTKTVRETKSNKEVKEMEINQEEKTIITNKDLDNLLKDIFETQINLDNLKVNFYRYNIEIFKKCQDKEKMEDILLKKVTKQGKINNSTLNHINKVKIIVKISKLSVIYDLYLFEGKSNNIKAYFYNIEKLVRLFEYLHINYTKEETLVVRKELNKLIKIVDKKEYNDTLAKSLSDLFKKYKIVLSDGGEIIKVTLTSEGINTFLSTLTVEQLEMVINQANILKQK